MPIPIPPVDYLLMPEPNCIPALSVNHTKSLQACSLGPENAQNQSRRSPCRPSHPYPPSFLPATTHRRLISSPFATFVQTLPLPPLTSRLSIHQICSPLRLAHAREATAARPMLPKGYPLQHSRKLKLAVGRIPLFLHPALHQRRIYSAWTAMAGDVHRLSRSSRVPTAHNRTRVLLLHRYQAFGPIPPPWLPLLMIPIPKMMKRLIAMASPSRNLCGNGQ